MELVFFGFSYLLLFPQTLNGSWNAANLFSQKRVFPGPTTLTLATSTLSTESNATYPNPYSYNPIFLYYSIAPMQKKGVASSKASVRRGICTVSLFKFLFFNCFLCLTPYHNITLTATESPGHCCKSHEHCPCDCGTDEH